MAVKNSVTIEGKIVHIEYGEKKINRNYTYGYMVLKVMSNGKRYSVLVGANNLNKFNYLPRIGHWIQVKGVLYPPSYYSMEPSIKYVKVLRHIKAPDINNKSKRSTAKT